MRVGVFGLVTQPEISCVHVISFYACSARLLLLACSWASSDSASLPLRRRALRPATRARSELGWYSLTQPGPTTGLPTTHSEPVSSQPSFLPSVRAESRGSFHSEHLTISCPN